MHENAAENYLAFYSSRLGGITTDPALMVVPMDDHLVHRGHAVFDTTTMTQVIHTVPAQTPCAVAAVGVAVAVRKAPCAVPTQGPALYELSMRLSVQASFMDQLFISMQG